MREERIRPLTCEFSQNPKRVGKFRSYVGAPWSVAFRAVSRPCGHAVGTKLYQSQKLGSRTIKALTVEHLTGS